MNALIMNHYRNLALALLLAATQPSQGQQSVCVDSDGDGWGWDGSGSCRIGAISATECIDSEPLNDGWGWNGVSSCRIEIAEPTCVDSPPLDDGWGWNGTESCHLPLTGRTCTDSPPLGDGWGWDGVESCRTQPAAADFLTKVEIPGVYSFSDLYTVGGLQYFETGDAHLYPEDGGRFSDVFIRDTQSNEIMRVSQGLNGAQANSHTYLYGVSKDGQNLLVASTATNLTTEPGNGVSQLYRYNVASQTFTPVSRGLAGEAPWSSIWSGVMLGDARGSILFASDSGNLVENDRNNTADIFLHTPEDGNLRRINLGPGGVEANGRSHLTGFSADGRFILFSGEATNLVENLPPGHSIYLYDTALDQLTTIPTVGQVPSWYQASISNDGNSIVYAYRYGDGEIRLAIHDRTTGATQNAYARDDSVLYQGVSGRPVLSPDGKYLAFRSSDTGISSDAEITTADEQIYLTNLETGETTLVSRSSDNQPANSFLSAPSFTGDGRVVRFYSTANNLAAGDSGDSSDLFEYSLP